MRSIDFLWLRTSWLLRHESPCKLKWTRSEGGPRLKWVPLNCGQSFSVTCARSISEDYDHITCSQVTQVISIHWRGTANDLSALHAGQGIALSISKNRRLKMHHESWSTRNYHHRAHNIPVLFIRGQLVPHQGSLESMWKCNTRSTTQPKLSASSENAHTSLSGIANKSDVPSVMIWYKW